MATITQLPEEVITIILKNEIISMEDIVNFKCTCERFRQITLLRNCPTAEKSITKKNRSKNKVLHHMDLEKKMQAGLYYIQELQYFANVASENKLNNTDVENLMHLLRLIAENSMTYYSKLFINLTHKYIFNQISRCLRYFRFIHKQIKFQKMQKRKLLLEKQFTILAQHFASHVSYSAVKAWLDEITERIVSRLKIKYPHSICSTILKQFSFWIYNNIKDNFWNETESREIMSVLKEYIFSDY
ncbi:hypothetical protein ACFW04_012077 [Cataglyphis niger]